MDEGGEDTEVTEDTKVTVLIADDDQIVRQVLRTIIESEPSLTLVGEAADATEAAELARELRPMVAVLDWMMPRGGGPQAATAITSDLPRTRLVALTSSDSQAASMDMLRAGARSILVKGASREEIVEAIHASLRY